jgi:hypothetical protein
VVSSDVVDVPLQVDVPAASTGQFPYVVPGVTNVARFFQSLDTTGTSGGELLTTSATVVFSYAPMWLHAADQ